LKVSICDVCIDIHAKEVAFHSVKLKSMLRRVRDEEDLGKLERILGSIIHDAVTMAYLKGHGPLNIQVEDGKLHILNIKGDRLCSDEEAHAAAFHWKKESDKVRFRR